MTMRIRTSEFLFFCGMCFVSGVFMPEIPKESRAIEPKAAHAQLVEFEALPLASSEYVTDEELLKLGSGIRDLRAAANEAHRFFVKANQLLTDIESGKRGVVLESRATLRVEARAK